MYVSPNFKTKAALKKAVAEGVEVKVFSPGPFPVGSAKRQTIEGPHYPEPHKWYAQVEVDENLMVTKVVI